ncbi:hypothetical protein K435DRAFT_809636 [Dendrothele bispora CBS 962.96]|uniref:Uncharacterized protein n=1 Tax=Dendrothele bispora (strain CBS 962.96) TaxID=1314807 RepID=A0A4S8KXL6_DENBC|nr:hypothetical protein K435DRAFT_809636 [Dendrothele bispora CBS 962.96]
MYLMYLMYSWYPWYLRIRDTYGHLLGTYGHLIGYLRVPKGTSRITLLKGASRHLLCLTLDYGLEGCLLTTTCVFLELRVPEGASRHLRVPEGASRHLRVPLDTYGCLRVPLDTLRVPEGALGCLWSTYGFLMGFFRHLRVPEGAFRHLGCLRLYLSTPTGT